MTLLSKGKQHTWIVHQMRQCLTDKSFFFHSFLEKQAHQRFAREARSEDVEWSENNGTTHSHKNTYPAGKLMGGVV